MATEFKKKPMNQQLTGDLPKAVFLSKAQREKLKADRNEALQRENDQKKKESNKNYEEYLEMARNAQKRDRECTRERERDEGVERRKKDRGRDRDRDRDRDRSRSKEKEDDASFLTGKELETLKGSYLGRNIVKRRVQKPSEKFRTIFNFEWDASEDTSQEINPLYAKKHAPQLLFGRGFIGGIDIPTQEKTYRQINQKSRSNKADIEQRNEERKGEERYRALEKTLHWSKKEVHKMTERDWRIFREDHDLVIKGRRVPKPIRTWEEADLAQFLLRAIEDCNYKTPMEIQYQAIPIGISRRDMIGIAPTGSGKSCAFIVPLIDYLNQQPPLKEHNPEDGPYGVILSPTRELAIQINEEFIKLAKYSRLSSTVVVGGRNAEEQSNVLSRGAELIIGTPGRILECLQKRYTVLNQCFYVILDEADKMIAMDLEAAVAQILDAIPVSNMKSQIENETFIQENLIREGKKVYRITQMFSATMPTQLERLAQKYLRNPLLVSIGKPGSGKKEIIQKIIFLPSSAKKDRLLQLLASSEPPIMVFVNTKKDVDALIRPIEQRSEMKCGTLHSGKSQDQREKALRLFREGAIEVLICTNLASRGLDIEGITHVINYDSPNNISDYTHRIGRTGRCGKSGLATTFLTSHDEEVMFDLRNFLIDTNQFIPHELNSHPAARIKPGNLPEAKPKGQQILYTN